MAEQKTHDLYNFMRQISAENRRNTIAYRCELQRILQHPPEDEQARHGDLTRATISS
jgi:hypothetical protein